MAMKLFILGLPGSGKSTVARNIAMYAVENWGRSTTHINDYAILYKMFQEDTTGQFKPANYGGFDVLDLTAFDVALQRLEQEVKAYISSENSDELILIEFARNDYDKAFHQFRPEFLQNAYFLYLNVDIETCKRRIRERITHPTTSDDHFVSEYIFSTYYNKDNGQDIPNILEEDYGIDMQRVMFIDNKGLLEQATPKINSFVDFVIASGSDCVDTASVAEALASIY